MSMQPNSSWGPTPTTWGNYQTQQKAAEYGPYRPEDPRAQQMPARFENTYDSYLNQYMNPVMGAFDQKAAALAAQRGALGGYGAQRGLMQEGNDIALQRLGLKEQGNQYDMDLARQQLGFVDEGLGIDRERVGTGKAYLDKLRGFNTRNYAIAGQERGLADRGANLSYDRNLFNLNSDATARGAYGSQGAQLNRGWLGQERDISLGQNALGYDKATIDYEQTGAQLDKQGTDLDFDLRESELSAKDKKSTLDNRLKQMDLLAKDFGLQRQDLENQLKKGLAQLGMAEQGALAQIMDAMASNEIGRQSAALEVITAAKAAADNAIYSGQARPDNPYQQNPFR